MPVGLLSPHYSTLSRRARRLELSLAAPKKIKHLVSDSTGLKVYGEGEWKVRTHGKDKRRTWRKLHISMEASTHHVTASSITDKELLDRNALSGLLEQTTSEIERVCADGAYDFEQRDGNLREIRKVGRQQWKRKSAYHKGSLVETACFRLKTNFSDRQRAKRMDTQSAEARIRCLVMNRMSELGMPQSYAV